MPCLGLHRASMSEGGRSRFTTTPFSVATVSCPDSDQMKFRKSSAKGGTLDSSFASRTRFSGRHIG